MKRICVLVDFTSASKVAIKYACTFAGMAKANLQILHVAELKESTDKEQIRKDLQKFAGESDLCKIDFDVIVELGDFRSMIPGLLSKHNSDLVIIATHGVKGIFHTIQGPEVLQLIQRLPIPSLVFQQQTPREFEGYKTILFTVSAHSNIQVKVDQTAAVAEIFNSTILLYALTGEDGNMEETLQANLEKARDSFSKRGIEYEVVYEKNKVYGVGYARQTLEFVSGRSVDLIAIMAHASDEHLYFGNIERSQFLLNKLGIPVLSCIE